MKLKLQNAWLIRILKVLSRHRLGSLPLGMICYFQYRSQRPALVIGIDALGVVLAFRVAGIHGCPHGSISYELLFDLEVGRAAKEQERAACRGLEFAIVQDELRGKHLSRENDIDPEKFFYMPVAGSGTPRLESGSLRSALGISPDKKIAIVIGSTDAWTGVPDLARTLEEWPPDWCLVIHHRYGLREELGLWIDSRDLERAYVSTTAVDSNEDMGKILADVDLGIALYQPDYASTLTGKNVECIGMASGKIATFLQCGVPVLTNRIGEMAKHIERLDLGGVVQEVADIPNWLAGFSVQDPSRARRCQEFFARHLDARVTGAEVFDVIDSIVRRPQGRASGNGWSELRRRGIEKLKRGGRIVAQPAWSSLNYLRSLGRPRGGVLVYVGMHRGRSFDRICRGYECCYGFEANPDLYAYLARRYARHENVRLFNLAAGAEDGEIEFNISSNDGMSSSIGNFDANWQVYSSGQVRTEKVIKVRCVNLMDFLRSLGVDRIDDYISDIQGMDLTVLSTLRPLIEAQSIGSIQCEVAKNERVNVFSDLPSNDERGFLELLGDRYELVGRGWGLLRDGRFEDVPEEWWEMDCKWRAKQA